MASCETNCQKWKSRMTGFYFWWRLMLSRRILRSPVIKKNACRASIFTFPCRHILILRRAPISQDPYPSCSECMWGHWITTAVQTFREFMTASLLESLKDVMYSEGALSCRLFVLDYTEVLWWWYFAHAVRYMLAQSKLNMINLGKQLHHAALLRDNICHL